MYIETQKLLSIVILKALTLMDVNADELIDDYKSYIYQHPDINALLSDFLQSVLITKPENIIDYATEFFAPFNNQTADRSLFRFADEKIPVPKPNISLK
ncbi:unnamed protein product [Rotaria magnacalcarata]|uniref:RIIa domain-containing protein n=1 Tax=Rotaria magnacalcarata TaxID=392030 RepID=A0A8S3JE59_9BILA|nr:unnamed protein product [Rotaria magnacalcarata]CAF5215573.1 unnamed protein product [Rotaria magnacalcarata]